MSGFAPVLNVLARILLGFGLMFLVPMAWAWALDAPELRDVWLTGMLLTLAAGSLTLFLTSHSKRELQPRDGFLLANLVWSVLPVFAAVPLLLAIDGLSFTDAYFEAMSGLTATGSTVLRGLDNLPVSVNVWRCFLQLVGGLGIMLLVVAVLPMLGLGGVQLYKAETPGPMKDARLTPRIAETARGLWGIYFVFSAACLLSYRWVGMSWADAFIHMCSTMGLGGSSSHDASFGYWNSPAIEWVATLFMFLAGISFLRYFMVWRARSLQPLSHDREVQMYGLVLLASVGVTFVMLLSHQPHASAADVLRASFFHVVSVATTTGYASQDYAQWPVALPVLMMFLGAFASCAGSTGGGIKMVRMVLLVKQARRELVRIIHPRVVNPVTLGGQTVPTPVMNAVLGFMLIYGGATMGLTFLMLLSGLDIVTAFSAVVATVNNIGPGLGQVGPSSNFGVLNAFQLSVLSFAMLLGRLEFLTVLVLFTRHFWRR